MHCRAWLHVSQEPTTGIGQKYETLWEKIAVQFHAMQCEKFPGAENTNRPIGSLQKKWSIIQHDVNKFCGSYASVCDLKVSGSNEEDSIKLAMELYQKTHPNNASFSYLHCWHVLKEVPKWQSFRSPGASSSGTPASQKRSASCTVEGDDSKPNRPVGGKKSKQMNAVTDDITNSIAQLQRESATMALANMKRAQAIEDQTHMALFSMDERSLPDETSRMFFKLRKQQIIRKLIASGDLPPVDTTGDDTNSQLDDISTAGSPIAEHE